MGVLRHELPDQQVLDHHRIIASNGLIAPRVTMNCRLLLRRVASRSPLPRERFSPLAHFEPRAIRGIGPSHPDKRTSLRVAACVSPRRF